MNDDFDMERPEVLIKKALELLDPQIKTAFERFYNWLIKTSAGKELAEAYQQEKMVFQGAASAASYALHETQKDIPFWDEITSFLGDGISEILSRLDRAAAEGNESPSVNFFERLMRLEEQKRSDLVAFLLFKLYRSDQKMAIKLISSFSDDAFMAFVNASEEERIRILSLFKQQQPEEVDKIAPLTDALRQSNEKLKKKVNGSWRDRWSSRTSAEGGVQ